MSVSLREQGGDLGVDVEDPVGLRLDVNDARLVVLHLRAVVGRVGDDDDGVAAVDEPRGGAVDLHLAGAALAGDRVGLEAGAVVDVDDGHLLVLEDVGGLEQVGVDGDRPDVVQVAVGHRGPVDLGLEHRALHEMGASLMARYARPLRIVLSMRRTPPTLAATARRVSPSIAATGARSAVETSSRYSGSTS